MVIKIAVADFTLSDNSACCLNEVEEGKSISLKFKRCEGIRKDKKPKEATETFKILEMYKAQSNI